MSVKFIQYALLVFILLATSSLQTVGIISVVSVASSVVGAYSSYYFDISTGGAIVFTQGLIFLAAFLYHISDFKGSKALVEVPWTRE